MLPFNRLIFAPSVAMIGNTVMIYDGVENAIEHSGQQDAANTLGTPLNSLVGKVYGEGANGDDIAEFAGRQCYRSWGKGRGNADYIDNVKAMGHGSIFEHASVVFQITGVSRSLTHELVRHRVGTAYSQESQRYVDAKDINFVVPPLLANGYENANLKATQIPAGAMDLFRRSTQRALDDYIAFQPLLKQLALAAQSAVPGDEKAATSAQKRANEAARALLPNATETRLVMTLNLRSLHHILTLRGTEYADLEIRRLTIALLEASRDYAPNFFRDVTLVYGSDAIEALKSGTARV